MLRILVSALIGIIFSLLSFSKAFSASEGLLFNALAAKRPATVPSREILLLEADEESIDAAGPLPWDNEVISEGLLILSEMRAGAVVFDFAIEKGTLIHTGMNKGSLLYRKIKNNCPCPHLGEYQQTFRDNLIIPGKGACCIYGFFIRLKEQNFSGRNCRRPLCSQSIKQKSFRCGECFGK